MQTYGPQGVTVTPIYWDPSRAKKHLSSSYERVINGFITNVAAASAASTNVFSIDSEYYDILGRQPSDIRYHMTAGTPIVDTRPLPGDRCYKTARGYDTCVTDDQLMAELSYVIAAHHLPRGLAYFYPVFLPPGVETQDGRGYTSASSYCAYHGSTGTGATQIVYGDEPYPPDGCYSGQSPNGDAAADSQIDTLSHEMNEAVTDPQFVGRGGWQDHAGFEVGDLCDWTFGPPLGFTDRRAPEATEYNQVINGGRYYVQLEFSNYAYQRFGVGDGCQ